VTFCCVPRVQYLLRKHGGRNGESGPRYYMSRLKENLPARRNELWHHSCGLAASETHTQRSATASALGTRLSLARCDVLCSAVFETTRYCLSYVNPFSYCLRKNKYQ
jgi:hypothetical protein